MKSKYIIFIVTIFIIAGCIKNSSQKKLYKSIINIEIESNIKNFSPLSITQISAKLNYITLKTPVANSIGLICNIEFKEDYILICDRDKVLLFDKNGQFLRSIGQKGRGPFEYTKPVSPKFFKDKIFISDLQKGVVIQYDFEGHANKAIRFPKNSFSGTPRKTNWIPISDSIFLVQVPNHSGCEKFRLIEIDRKGLFRKGFSNTTFFTPKILSNGRKSHYSMISTTLDGHLYGFNESFRFHHPHNDTIWEVIEDELIPVYVLNRGKFGIPTYYLGQSIEDVSFRNKLKAVIHIKSVVETFDYIFISTAFGNNYPFKFIRSSITASQGTLNSQHNILGIYNKQTAEFFFVAPSGIDYQLEPLGIENDIDGGINFAPMYSPNERTLVSWFNAMDLKAHVASEGFKNSKPKYPEKKKELEALANRLKDTDNPVLMVVTME